MKVFELAKKIGIASKELIARLKALGIEAKSHMSQLDDNAVKTVIERFSNKNSATAATSEVLHPKKGAKILIKRPKTEEKPELQVQPVMAEKPSELKPVTHEELKTTPLTSPKGEPILPSERKAEKKPVITEGSRGKEALIEEKEKPLKKVKKLKLLQERNLMDRSFGIRQWYEPPVLPKREVRPKQVIRKVKPAEPVEPTKLRKKVIKVEEGITVKDFAEKIGQKAGEVIKKLMEMGVMATINQPIDLDAAVLIADGYGLKIEVTPLVNEENLLEEAADEPATLEPRPPVVTIMGHVDHGKTSLLDAVRQTKIVDLEAGGITQHIGAYKVSVNQKEIVFLDTPGHEAFTAMRARGAQVTDIVILVVAADDGVMPQTIEAINHAKAAGVPIIVAINKIDKPNVNPERVKNSLVEYGLIPEAWGGQTIFAEVSAKKKIGIENLLEMILLQAEVLELKANPNKMARGTVIEAKLDKGRGPIATVLVRRGTLKVGDAFVTGIHYGRVRALIDDEGKRVDEAMPSTPVEVLGLPGVPVAGDSFIIVEDERKARQITTLRLQKAKAIEQMIKRPVSLEDLHQQIKEGEVKELSIIVKADVQGSVEAVKDALEKLSTEQIKLRVIHGAVGGITETDVMLASASNAIIIGFTVRPEPKAQEIADREKVDIRVYRVIYDAINDVKAAMEGLLEPTLKERVLGRAEVRQTFSIPKVGVVAGVYVTDGTMTRASAGIRVIRDNVIVYEGKIGSLKRFKEDVKEVQGGYECGIGIENFNDIKIGDVLEAYTFDAIPAKL